MAKSSDVEWNESTEFPDELSKAENGFSVDVLVYSKKSDEHTVGWFNYNSMSWVFLCRQALGKFKWRYFDLKNDKP